MGGEYNVHARSYESGGDDTHDVAEHVEEATVGVVGEPVATLDGQPRGHLVVEPQVEHRVHHTGHGHRGTGADREEEWLLGVAEARAHVLLHPLQAVDDFLPQPGWELLPGLLVLLARLRRHGEPRRHRQPDARHLGKVRALTTELQNTPKDRPRIDCSGVNEEHQCT
jgi:hypothetical protein